MRKLSVLIVFALLLGMGFIFLTPGPGKPRDLTSEVYVWQRQHTEALNEAVTRLAHTPGLASVAHFLAAEVHWNEDKEMTLRRFDLLKAPELLKSGAVIRVGTPPASGWTDQAIGELAKVVNELAQTAAEIQIDYDCPQSRLAEYTNIVRKMRSHTDGVSLCVTALPCWLSEPEFKRLAGAVDGYVLQVHSLHLPTLDEDRVALIDSAEAIAATEHASRLGFPFRIALPTYGCAVYLDRDRKVIDVIAEDGTPPPIGPHVSSASLGYSDPMEIASLVAHWKQSPPEHLTGLIWFRLPTSDDSRNWSFRTLARVASGSPVRENIQIDCVEGVEGSFDVVVTNVGEIDAHLPGSVRIDGGAAFADGIGGYRVMPDSSKGTTFVLTNHNWPWLRPQDALTIGWIRTSENLSNDSTATIAKLP
jgi:hypothetical protein